MAELIQARTLKGFRDSLPYGAQGERRRQDIIFQLSKTFRQIGYEPIDTPVLEYSDILIGKAGEETEKQIYRFEDQGGRDVAMRFDLTVPFARFVAQHQSILNMPFKRYHIAKVWRGENSQKGRYREFYQCDFDIVGDASSFSDLQVLLTVHNVLEELRSNYSAMGKARIHFNHRGLLNSFWQQFQVSEEQQLSAMQIIDKVYKIGSEQVRAQLNALLGEDCASKLCRFLQLDQPSADNQQRLANISELLGEDKPVIQEIRETLKFGETLNMKLLFDPCIARGLDYYTGIVFECFLEALPSIGSVCSGGRYDNLTQLYSKTAFPGVGGSIGLDRLLTALEELERDQGSYLSDSNWLLSLAPEQNFGRQDKTECLNLSVKMQKLGLYCEAVPQFKKWNQLYNFANGKNISQVIILTEPLSDANEGKWQIRYLDKNTKHSEVHFTSMAKLIQYITDHLT